MQTVVVLITMMVLLFIGYNRERVFLTTFILLLVFLVFQQRFTIRPDLFSLLFFSLYIFTLAIHIDKRWTVPFLFIVQVLWSNMHGFFFFGPLFVLIGIVSELIKRKARLPYEWNETGRLTNEEFRRLIFLFFVVAAASLFNPGFVKGAFYPIRVFFTLSGENKIFFDYIQELQRPIASWGAVLRADSQIYYKMLILISFLSFVFNRRRIDISALIFWIIFLFFSLTALRNTAYFAFAAYLVIMTNLVGISLSDIVPIRFTQQKFVDVTMVMVSLMLLAWIFQYTAEISRNGYYDFDNYKRKSEFGGISQRNYPDKAVQFLVDNKVSGNIFNDFNSGAYLLGHVFPNIKVYIDGRTEVYGGDFFRHFRKIWTTGDKELFEADERKYGLDIVFLNSSKDDIPSGILNYIYKNPEWKLVYFDYDGLVFLKDIEKFRPLIEKFVIDLNKWAVPPANLRKIGAHQIVPYRYLNRAYTLEALGLDDLALQESEQAVSVAPSYSKAYELMGKIYAKRKDQEKAFKYFRLAAAGSTTDAGIRYNLALSYYDLGDYAGAVEQYKDIMELEPSLKTELLLSRSLIQNESYNEAVSRVTHLKTVDKRSEADVIALGDLLFEKGQLGSASTMYDFAYKKYGNRSPHLFKMMGKIYQAKNDRSRAKKYFEQAAGLDPHDAELSDLLKQAQ